MNRDIRAVEAEIEKVERQYRIAVQRRVQGSMTCPTLLARVQELREQLTENKRTLLELKRLAKKVEDDARSQAYADKLRKDAAELLNKGRKRERLALAMGEIVKQFLELTPGSFDVAYLHCQIDRIKSELFNESRRK